MTARFIICSLALAVAGFLSLAAAPPQHRGPPRDFGRREHRGPPPMDRQEPKPDPYPSTYKPLPRVDTIIVNATILDGAGHRIEHGRISLHDGLIVDIGPGQASATPTANTTVIDAAGRWVTPGIVDPHSHDGTYVTPLTANDSEASDVSELSSPDASGTWVEHAVNVQDPSFYRALESGVTTLQVLPGSIPIIGGRSVVLKPIPANYMQAMKFPGAPRGLKMSCGDNARGYFGPKGKGPNSRMGVIEMLRHELAEARDEHHGHPDADDLRKQTLVAMLAGELPVHIHCYRADDMAVMLGVAKEYGFHITAFHHAAEAYKIADLLRANGTCAVVWADWWGFKREASDAIRANAAMLQSAGVCVALHSDSPLMGQRLNVEAGKAMASGRRAGIDIAPEVAIEWITSNPARMLGLGDRIGSLAPGKNADLVIWSGNPFSVYSRAEKVFVDGALAFDRSDPSRRPRSDFELGRLPQ